MNIYQVECEGCSIYGFIVVCENEQQARETYPSYADVPVWNSLRGEFGYFEAGSWVSWGVGSWGNPSKVDVKLLGTAAPDVKSGIVYIDFAPDC